MKKFMVLCLALTFLATFALGGCDQSPQPSKPAPEKGATGAPGAAGAPGAPGAPETWSTCASPS